MPVLGTTGREKVLKANAKVAGLLNHAPKHFPVIAECDEEKYQRGGRRHLLIHIGPILTSGSAAPIAQA